jgi:orotidine-5'-phosphate decarboxylase
MKVILSLEKKEHFLIAEKVQDYVDGWKIGHIGYGITKYDRTDPWARLNHYRLAPSKEIFFDFKLWDTPNTVKTVIEACIKSGATMATVSTFNNDAVYKELEQYKDDIKLLAVTYLTSWDSDEQYEICRELQHSMWLRHLDRVMNHGFYGVVCSARDIETLSETDYFNQLKKVCPGITFGDNLGGQVRSVSPKEALDYGADYIVVGRLITESSDPIATAKKIKDVC